MYYRPFQDRKSCPHGWLCDGHLIDPKVQERARRDAGMRVEQKRRARREAMES